MEFRLGQSHFLMSCPDLNPVDMIRFGRTHFCSCLAVDVVGYLHGHRHGHCHGYCLKGYVSPF
jgi:hypothetical protein